MGNEPEEFDWVDLHQRLAMQDIMPEEENPEISTEESEHEKVSLEKVEEELRKLEEEV